MSARLTTLRRALVACAVLFALLLTFLSLQMLRGRDPSVRTAQARASAPATKAATTDDGSVLASIVGFAASVITDGGDDDHGDGGSSMKTQTS